MKIIMVAAVFLEMQADVIAGRPGYSVFESHSLGQDAYFYYQPVGVGNLSLQVTVPESVVFADDCSTPLLMGEGFLCAIK